MISDSDVECFGTLSAAEILDNTHVALNMLLRRMEKELAPDTFTVKPHLRTPLK